MPWMTRVTMIPARGNVLENLLSTAAAATHREKPAQMSSPYLLSRDMYWPEAIEASDCGRTTGRIIRADCITVICRTIW